MLISGGREGLLAGIGAPGVEGGLVPSSSDTISTESSTSSTTTLGFS